jgi:hypothetical protein
MSIDVTDITTDHVYYSSVRTVRRADIIPVRAARRVTLGDLIGLEFENSQTLTFQTQEMVYTERLTSSHEVEHEIAAYSRMLPTHNSLVATFFIYLRDPQNIKHQLAAMQGLHQSVHIEVGQHHVAGIPIPPSDEESDDQTVAVHVLRFTFNAAALAAFKDEAIPATVVIEHHSYSDDRVIDVHMRERLIGDLL